MASQVAVMIDGAVFCAAAFRRRRYAQFLSAGSESSPGQKFLKGGLQDRCQRRRNFLLPDKRVQVGLDFVIDSDGGAPHNPHFSTNFTKW